MDSVEILEGDRESEIDQKLLNKVRREILSKNQYSFYKHELNLEELSKIPY